MQQRKQHLCPEGPQRPQPACAERSVEQRAQADRQQHEQPQLAPAHAQGKEKRSQREGEAVEHVERAGQRARGPPPQAHGAQQIIDERERRAQQERGKKALPLRVQREAHCAQPPNRRPSSPPRAAGASS